MPGIASALNTANRTDERAGAGAPAAAASVEIVDLADPAVTAAWTMIEGQGGASGVCERLDFIKIAAQASDEAGSRAVIALVRGLDGRPRTLLPLRISRQVGTVIAQGIAAPLAQSCDVVGAALSDADLDRISAALRHDLGVDLVLLRKVRRDSGLWAALAARGASQNALEAAPYIDLTTFPTFADYDASFSRVSRRSRKQRWRKLEERVGVVAFSVQPGAQTEEFVATAIAWKRAWCAAQAVSSAVFDDRVWCRALQRAATLPYAYVSVLTGNGRPLAIELGFVARGEYSSYFAAYDPEFAAFGVGQLQLYKSIEWAHAQGVARFDLLAPDSEFKRQWARGETAVAVDDFALPLSLVGRGLADLRRRLRPLAKNLILGMKPEVRLAGRRIGVPAGIVTAIGMAIAVSLE